MDSPVLVHAQTPPSDYPKTNYLPMVLAVVLIIVAGLGTGYVLAHQKSSKTTSQATSDTMVKTVNEAGTTDTKTFKDVATGELQSGGINGEGTHKLVRPGGVSQTVYLISSLVDLDSFVGKKVEVYGQTIKAKSAGWLMDVGRIKVVQ